MTSTTGEAALNWMEISRISHLPIVNNGEFLGLISDTDIYDTNTASEPIGNHSLSLLKPFVFEEQHVYEVIRLISDLKLTVVPVLDHDNRYMGVITLPDLVQNFGKLTAVVNPGGIIVLEMNMHDLSMSEISQIVEGNDTKILSMYVSSSNDSTKVQVTLKLNREDTTAVHQTFYRYGYEIVGAYAQHNRYDDMNLDRYEEFLTYLNV